MDKEILTCPYCGSGQIRVQARGGEYGLFYYVQCLNCAARTKASSKLEVAVDLWNRRTAPETAWVIDTDRTPETNPEEWGM